jgi:hypothetical protein
MPRGRLLFPFLAELGRFDASTTTFDEDFKEGVLVDADDDGIGERRRGEHPSVRIPCQVEPERDDEQRVLPSGNAPRSRLALVMHFEDLERMSLVDASTGDAIVRPGDRLGALYTLGGALVQRFAPGLYVTEARSLGFGLGGMRNLLLVRLSDRPQGAGRNGA